MGYLEPNQVFPIGGSRTHPIEPPVGLPRTCYPLARQLGYLEQELPTPWSTPLAHLDPLCPVPEPRGAPRTPPRGRDCHPQPPPAPLTLSLAPSRCRSRGPSTPCAENSSTYCSRLRLSNHCPTCRHVQPAAAPGGSSRNFWGRRRALARDADLVAPKTLGGVWGGSHLVRGLGQRVVGVGALGGGGGAGQARAGAGRRGVIAQRRVLGRREERGLVPPEQPVPPPTPPAPFLSSPQGWDTLGGYQTL